MFAVRKLIKKNNIKVLFAFIIIFPVIFTGCSGFEQVISSGDSDASSSGEGPLPSFSGSYIELIDANGGNTYGGEDIKVNISVVNSGGAEAKNVEVNLITHDLFEPGIGRTSWNIDVLGAGEESNFVTGLTLIDDINEDTRAEVGLEISSDEVDSFIGPDCKMLVYGERQFDGVFIPIIGMHAIEDHIEEPIELYTGHFDKLCGVLKEYGYETITLKELLDYIDFGRPLPEKPVIITSDDGFQDVYTNGFPILKKYGYRMTVFLVTGAIGDTEADRKTNAYFEKEASADRPIRPILIWPEIKEMYEYGCEFQSHTVNHVRLGIAYDETILYELTRSKEDIESHLGNEVLFVALPKGNYNPDKTPLFVEAGYRGALRHAGGAEDTETIDLFNMKRVEFNSLISPEQYVNYLNLDRSIEISYEAGDKIKKEGEEFIIEFIIGNTGEDGAGITSLELELPDNVELTGVSPEGYVKQYPGLSEGVYMWVSDSYIIDSNGQINLMVKVRGTDSGRSVVKFRATYKNNYINCDDIEIEIR